MEKFREIIRNDEGKINAYSGRVIDFKKPTPDMIVPSDIANALGKICRFGGQISHYYSVAQHSVLVEHLAPLELKRAALLHDAAEAYLGDVITPLKKLLGNTYAWLEQEFEEAIFTQFNEPIDNIKLVKPYDMLAYQMENNAFKKGHIQEWATWWKNNLNYECTVWPADYACKEYAAHLVRRFRREVRND
jgi:hypothetical protein